MLGLTDDEHGVQSGCHAADKKESGKLSHQGSHWEFILIVISASREFKSLRYFGKCDKMISVYFECFRISGARSAEESVYHSIAVAFG